MQPANPDDGRTPDPAKGSTGSHRPGAEPSLSDLLRSGSSARRRTTTSDIAQMLGPPGASPTRPDAAGNTDDAPTIITQNHATGRPPAPPPPPYVVGDTPSVAGRRLGHFELIEAVGAGGMAAVLKARDLELGRIVALKILPPEATHDPENVTRFKQEARSAARLDHENVARVYFCGEDQGLHFIAFEFVEGINLRQMIDRRGPLPAGECVRYMIQVAAGLAHAAERGVVHRDIKPSNIIITPDGRAKIVDMGLARHLDNNPVNGGVTQSGVTLGTFDYISPEQALDPRRADVRSDIYSLGCAFYHALTGRPPVPEGTAAKKLYAHQHVDPTDPRLLNPAIPDELAAVLARMMVKEPDRRYQTPAELIAHLKGVADRLHLSWAMVTTDSVVRAVAADPRVLPDPPRLRLGWVAAAVAVAVAVAVIAVSLGGPGGQPNPAPWWPDPNGKKDDPGAGVAGGTPAGNPAGPGGPQIGPDGFLHARTAEQLAQALADPKTTKVRLAAGTYDLTKLDKGVLFQGRELELLGPGAKVLLAGAALDPAAPARPGTLTFAKAESVAVRGVRFELIPPADGPDELPLGLAGLAAVDVAALHFTDCLFVPDPASRPAAVAAVLVARTTDELAPQVHLERCLFAPGGVGLRIPARSKVTAHDCGFGPLTAAVQVRSDVEATNPEPARAEVRFDRSSFMLEVFSAAVEVEEGVAAQVSAGYCVFAPAAGSFAEPIVPGMPAAPRRGAVVRVGGTKLDTVRFTGDSRNTYYRVDPVASATRGHSFDELRSMTPPPAEDRSAVTLRQRPWDAPEGGTLAAFAAADPHRAFKLNLADPALFLPDRGIAVVGAQFHATGIRRAYAGYAGVWPPAPPAVAAADARQKVWTPGADESALRPNEYKDLVKLLRDVRPGDEVLIRHTGPLTVEPTEVKSPGRSPADRAEFRITFKPEPGSRPVLVPARGNDLDAAMFRLRDGEVTFEGLEFLVKPATTQTHRAVSAVTVVAARGCVFRDCVFTLAEDDAKAAAVLVSDPDGVMKMDTAGGRSVPRLRFEDCLLRGKGRGVWVPVSRPLEIDAVNTVVALDGPIFQAEPAGRDPGAASRTQLRLTRVTALLAGPVVELHAGKIGETRASGLVPVDVKAEGCVFAAVPGAGRPLADLDGIDPADVTTHFTWEAVKPNRYANFDPSQPVVVIRTADEAKNWDWDQWLGFAREVGRPVGKITFASPPGGTKDLAGLKPADAAVKTMDFPDLDGARPGDAGADTRDVARPAAAGGDD